MESAWPLGKLAQTLRSSGITNADYEEKHRPPQRLPNDDHVSQRRDRKALDILQLWRDCVPDYEYVYVAVNRGDNIQQDIPISTETVRRVCLQSGDFKPHDARRTLITRMLLSGTALPDAQYTAGHASGATTMAYAVVKDAKEVKGRIKIDY
jgi:integrase